MNLDGAPRVLGQQAAASQPASSCEDFDKKLLTLLEIASVDKVVELLNRYVVRELRLSGDYLSIDGFTTLTVALPKTQVTRLHMASCGITDDYPVGNLLGEHSKLVELDLSSNRLALRSARSISIAFGQNNTLVRFDLSHNHLDHEAYYGIMRYVCAAPGQQPANKTLRELSFKGNSDGEMFAPLYVHVRAGMSRSPAHHFQGEALASLGVPVSLTRLDLSDTGLIGDDPAFANLLSITTLTLILDGNQPAGSVAPFVAGAAPVIDSATGGVIVQTTASNLVLTTTATTPSTRDAAATGSSAWPLLLSNTAGARSSIDKFRYAEQAILSADEWRRRLSVFELIDLSNLNLFKLPPLPASNTKLDISGNQLPRLLELPQSLVWLKACNNKLTEFPERLPPRLEEIDLRNNEIVEISKSVTWPAHLKKVNLAANKLTEFPQSLPPRLEEIDLSYNDIVQFPKNVTWPDRLKVVYLRDCGACPSDKDMLKMPDGCQVIMSDVVLCRVGKTVCTVNPQTGKVFEVADKKCAIS